MGVNVISNVYKDLQALHSNVRYVIQYRWYV